MPFRIRQIIRLLTLSIISFIICNGCSRYSYRYKNDFNSKRYRSSYQKRLNKHSLPIGKNYIIKKKGGYNKGVK